MTWSFRKHWKETVIILVVAWVCCAVIQWAATSIFSAIWKLLKSIFGCGD